MLALCVTLISPLEMVRTKQQSGKLSYSGRYTYTIHILKGFCSKTTRKIQISGKPSRKPRPKKVSGHCGLVWDQHCCETFRFRVFSKILIEKYSTLWIIFSKKIQVSIGPFTKASSWIWRMCSTQNSCSISHRVPLRERYVYASWCFKNTI